MATQQKFGSEARAALLAGAKQVYLAVGSTMGARGRNVVRQKFGQPRITNDGVTVANSIDLADPFERQGADLIKEAARTTVAEAGDGTSSSIVVSFTSFQEGLTLLDRGENPMVFRNKIEKEVDKVLKKLKEISIPVTTDAELEHVASISVENKEHGKIIAKAVKTIGKDGLVIVEEDYKPGIFSEEVNGYQFERGLEIPYLVGDANKMVTIFPNKGEEDRMVPILVADKSWNIVEDLFPLFDELKKGGDDKLVIIAEEISGSLAAFLVKNRLEQRFHAVVVKPPFNKDMLEDIATLTGATAITNIKGIVNVKKEHLGYAKKVIITNDTTTIIDGQGDVAEKIEDVRDQIESCEEEYLKPKLQERLAKLTGKTVILKIGADTEAETRYLKDKFDDAVAATRAAVEEGIVAGGGMALAQIAEALYKPGKGINDFMIKVLESPAAKILENAGVTETEGMFHGMGTNAGYDALKGEIVPDMVLAGIIDPTKVVRCAFKNAMSLSCTLLTVDTVIAEIPDHETRNR